MSFNSLEFAFFLPTVLLLYTLVFRYETIRNLFLLAASYFFYMSWDWRYAGLLAFSTIVDYFVGTALNRTEGQAKRKMLLGISLIVNLGLLCVFKYYNFFMDMGEETTKAFGFHNLSFPHHRLLLPVGISFYTFQTLSYTIDLYRRRISYEKNIVKFAMYVSFFPQLVAGPIVRASHFLPQLRKILNVTQDRFHSGLFLVFQGLFKKIVIADLLAGLGIEEVFANPTNFTSWDLLFALYGYSFQIYNDFSGYSDIAIGVGRMIGFDIPSNFRRPYLSESLREFWTRWHISLSTWLRDYLYIPLGGNRVTRTRLWFNLMLTMLLGGLWHGAAWNFVIWGAYHGILLLIGRSMSRRSPNNSGSVRFFRKLTCYHLVLFGWLIFRVESIDHLYSYINGLLNFSFGTKLYFPFYLVLGLGILTHIVSHGSSEKLKIIFFAQPIVIRATIYSLLILAFCGLTLRGPQFIYFQF